MIATLASRQDLARVKADIVALPKELGTVRQEFSTLRQDNALIREEMEFLSSRLVIQVGSMLIVGFGPTITSLKYFLG